MAGPQRTLNSKELLQKAFWLGQLRVEGCRWALRLLESKPGCEFMAGRQRVELAQAEKELEQARERCVAAGVQAGTHPLVAAARP